MKRGLQRPTRIKSLYFKPYIFYYGGNYSSKTYGSGRGAKAKAINERVCGNTSGNYTDWCKNKKTGNYDILKRGKLKRKFEQSHDGKFCRPRNDKRERDSDGRIIRKYEF